MIFMLIALLEKVVHFQGLALNRDVVWNDDSEKVSISYWYKRRRFHQIPKDSLVTSQLIHKVRTKYDRRMFLLTSTEPPTKIID